MKRLLGFPKTLHNSPKPGAGSVWQAIDSERVLRVLMRNLDGMMFRCAIDQDWSIHFASDGAKKLTGYAPEELASGNAMSLEVLTHPDDRQAVRDVIMLSIVEGRPYRIEYRIICRDGTEKWVLERGSCVIDELGSRVLEGFIEDISEQVHAQIRRAEAELRYKSIFENSVIGMFQTTSDGRYLAANQALADLYGYASPQHLVEGLADIAHSLYVDPQRRKDFAQAIRDAGRVRDFESEVYCFDGRRIWISENAHGVRGPDGTLLYYEGTVEDISERRRHQAELEYQATHDPLTGLPNRNLLQDRLQQTVESARRNRQKVAVAFVDLDKFKVINDSLGHAVGDRLLQEIASRLKNCIRAVDTVARYGGDEFVLIMQGHEHLGDLIQLLERILSCIGEPVLLEGHELRVGGSIGITIYPQDGQDLATLLRQADAAMYEAKSAGRNQFQFYRPELNQSAHERLEMEMALRGALDANELSVHYQPKIDGDGRVVGFEALARWHSPVLGSVSPARFIPLAEETGLIRPITDFVLRTACRDAAVWAARGWPGMHMAVNLSAQQFSDPKLLEQIAEVLSQSGLPADCLQIEITESMLVGNVEGAARTLTAIKAQGIRVAVDDFGTGYSSLAYLKRFPIDILKIDRSFVMECDTETDGMAIANAVIALGHSLGMRIVAEGVERAAQLQLLRQQGCEEFQGYLIARPMPPGEVMPFLQLARGGLSFDKR